MQQKAGEVAADYEGKFLASMKRDAAFLDKGFAYVKEATTQKSMPPGSKQSSHFSTQTDLW